MCKPDKGSLCPKNRIIFEYFWCIFQKKIQIISKKGVEGHPTRCWPPCRPHLSTSLSATMSTSIVHVSHHYVGHHVNHLVHLNMAMSATLSTSMSATMSACTSKNRKTRQIQFWIKYLWIETKVEDGVDADGRLGEQCGQGQQVMRHYRICFEP